MTDNVKNQVDDTIGTAQKLHSERVEKLWKPHTLETSGEDVKTKLETSGEDVKTKLETSVEDVKTTLETSGEDVKTTL